MGRIFPKINYIISLLIDVASKIKDNFGNVNLAKV